MLRFYTAPLPGTSYKAMEAEADPLDPITEFFRERSILACVGKPKRLVYCVLVGVHPRVCGETFKAAQPCHLVAGLVLCTG